MKAVVTGGTGFIGSALVRHLYTHDHDIKVLGRRTGVSTNESIKDIMSDINILDLDLQNYSQLCQQVRDADVIYHLAAESHVAKSIENPEPFIKTNILGTMNILNAAMDMGVKNFVHISSCEVYGETDLNHLQSEDTSPLRPKSPYAASKGGADTLAQSYISTYGYPIVIVRPCNNYGPWQHHEKVVPRFIRQFLRNANVTVHGEGGQEREWIYVEDCAEAIYRSTFITPGVYNIGTGSTCNINMLANMLKTCIPDSKSKIIYTTDREGQVKAFQLDGRKFAEATNWKAQTIFNKGIVQTIQWYRKYYGTQ